MPPNFDAFKLRRPRTSTPPNFNAPKLQRPQTSTPPNFDAFELRRLRTSTPSYDLETPSDALNNQIEPSVWPLQCFEVIKPEPQKTEICEIPFFSRVHASHYVGRSVGPSVSRSALTKTSRISTIRLFQRWRRSVMIWRAPVEVYTALLLPLPKSTRLMTPCIRPCSISH